MSPAGIFKSPDTKHCYTPVLGLGSKIRILETEDFSAIESMSFTFSGSGFNVVVRQCVLFTKDTDVNQAAAAQKKKKKKKKIKKRNRNTLIRPTVGKFTSHRPKRMCDQTGRLKPFDSVKSHPSGEAILCKCRDNK